MLRKGNQQYFPSLLTEFVASRSSNNRPFHQSFSTSSTINMSMKAMQEFINLQLFELIYLLVLAFLPFFIAQKVVGLILLSIIAVFASYYVFKRVFTKTIEITGQAVLITGCDSGFGNAIAWRLDGMGFLVLAACLSEKSEGAERLKMSTSGRIHVFELDVTSDKSVANCLDRVNQLASDRGLWALINNAGINFAADFEFCTLDMFKKVMEVNLYGVIRMTKTFLPLVRRAKGRVINISSAKGQLSLPGNSVYGITKYGIEALTDVLRLEMAGFDVKAVVVEPGNFGGATGMLSKSTLYRMRDEYDEMWEQASPQVKETYGKKYLDAQYDSIAASASSTSSTLAPVIDAMEDAVCNIKPRARYLVGGSSQWWDFNNVLIQLKPFVPTSWVDSMITKTYITPFPKPTQAVR